MRAQDGISCLFMASQNGHLEVVKDLCKRGGMALLMLTRNVSKLVICIQFMSSSCLHAYYKATERGGDMHTHTHTHNVFLALACSQDGTSCLYTACRSGHVEVVKHFCDGEGKALLTLTGNVSVVGFVIAVDW
jgi:hypothetical protein